MIHRTSADTSDTCVIMIMLTRKQKSIMITKVSGTIIHWSSCDEFLYYNSKPNWPKLKKVQITI